MQDRVPRGEMRGVKVVLIQPHSDLSSSDDGDHYIGLRYTLQEKSELETEIRDGHLSVSK